MAAKRFEQLCEMNTYKTRTTYISYRNSYEKNICLVHGYTLQTYKHCKTEIQEVALSCEQFEEHITKPYKTLSLKGIKNCFFHLLRKMQYFAQSILSH